MFRALKAGLIQNLLTNFNDKTHFFSDGNKLCWRNHSASGMGPSQQRLTSQNISGLQIKERLIVKLKRLGL